MKGRLSTPNGKISQKNFYGFPRTFPPEDTLSRLFSACGRTFPANSARKGRPRPPQKRPAAGQNRGRKSRARKKRRYGRAGGTAAKTPPARAKRRKSLAQKPRARGNSPRPRHSVNTCMQSKYLYAKAKTARLRKIRRRAPFRSPSRGELFILRSSALFRRAPSARRTTACPRVRRGARQALRGCSPPPRPPR